MGLILVIFLISLSCAYETIVRKEYGVLFTPLGQLNTATSSWHHTFAYDVNSRDVPVFHLEHCHNDELRNNVSDTYSFFHVVCETYHQYASKAQLLISQINDGQRSLDTLLPTVTTRAKRGVIDAVGHASKWLFGISTEEDTRKLQRQIDCLRYRIDRGQSEFTASLAETRSNMKQLSKRQDLTNNALRLLENELELRMEDVWEHFRIFRNHQHALWQGNLYLDMLHDLRYEISNEVFGIQTLLDGYLPVNIIPPSIMEEVLTNLSRVLMGHDFRLAVTDVAAYYKTRDVVYERHSDYLFITIKIPLESIRTSYQLFRVDTVPLLSGEVQTQIKFSEPYLAVSEGNFFYFQMSEADYSSCTGVTFQKCHRGFAIKEHSNPSCIMSLFENDHVKIKELCDFQFLLNSDQITTQILPVDEHSYLISTTDTAWIQTCPRSTPMHVPSCKLCVIQLPCLCSLKGRTFFIPPSLEQCNSSLNQPATKVSHNFATLMKYYEDLLPALNLSSQLLQTNGPVRYPDLDITSKQFQEVLKESDDIGVSINTSLDKLKNSDQVYADSVSYLYDRLGLYSSPIVTKGMPALSSLTFIVSVCALAIALRNFFVMAALVKKADARPWLSLATSPAPHSSPKSTCIPCSTLTYVLWSVVILLCLIVLWLAFRKLCTRNESQAPRYSSHTMVSLIFAHNTEFVELLLVLVPFPLDVLEITVAEVFTRPQVMSRWFHRKLVFNWAGIRIKVTGLEGDLLLPIEICVPVRKYRKYVQMIQSAEVVQLRAACGDCMKIVNTWIGEQIRE